jgi:hypothetical protein
LCQVGVTSLGMFDDFPATPFAENGMLAALDAFAFV